MCHNRFLIVACFCQHYSDADALNHELLVFPVQITFRKLCLFS